MYVHFFWLNCISQDVLQDVSLNCNNNKNMSVQCLISVKRSLHMFTYLKTFRHNLNINSRVWAVDYQLIIIPNNEDNPGLTLDQ